MNKRLDASAAAQVLLQPWLTRRSVSPRRLQAPGPDADLLPWLLEAAANAPDHGRLRPCRLAVLDEVQRVRLGRAFQAYLRRGTATPDAQALEREMQRALDAPCLIAVTASIRADLPEIAPHEQWIAVGAVLGNLMAAAHALGFAGKVLSGARVHDPSVRAELCRGDETLVGFVHLGTPAPQLAERG